jgi:hypothetical protein
VRTQTLRQVRARRPRASRAGPGRAGRGHRGPRSHPRVAGLGRARHRLSGHREGPLLPRAGSNPDRCLTRRSRTPSRCPWSMSWPRGGSSMFPWPAEHAGPCSTREATPFTSTSPAHRKSPLQAVHLDETPAVAGAEESARLPRRGRAHVGPHAAPTTRSRARWRRSVGRSDPARRRRRVRRRCSVPTVSGAVTIRQRRAAPARTRSPAPRTSARRGDGCWHALDALVD